MEEVATTVRAATPAAEGTRVKRKLVQATLFPHNGAIVEEEENDDVLEVDEEWQGSRKRKQNQKRNSKPRKVKSNGKDSLKKKVSDGESDDIPKSGFFVKFSEKQVLKREEKEEVCVASNGVGDILGSPSIPCADTKISPRAKSTPKKQTPKKKTTPKKKIVGSGSKGASMDEPIIHTTPNLRLEAKLLAEENSRIYAGKEIHPFFSLRKVDKKKQEIIDVETDLEKQGKGNGFFNPIHVFERDELEKNEKVGLDWGNWEFSDTCGVESGVLSSYKECIKLIDVTHDLVYENEMRIDEEERKKRVNMEDDDSCCIAYDSEWKGRFCKGSCQNCLWTDRYQPKKGIQVCGNGEIVKQLSEWLHLWHEKCCQNTKTVTNYSESESDSDGSDDEETSLENVLLVTGPVGSGKSAAIYACAKEQGFQVIEINASDWRNGALVKQKFGEAMESHWLQGSMINQTTPKKKSDSDSDHQLILPLSSELDGGIGNYDKTKMKSLILFEDVDATLYEDSGFISTIQQLAKTGKRPMILTSNSENPLLPNSLERLHLCFTLPSLEELNGLANVVCDAENCRIDSSMVEQLVDLCERDIRKSIMNLQFWCQGEDIRMKGTSAKLVFDIDAFHRVLPKIVGGCGYPCGVSQYVEEEITKAMNKQEEENDDYIEAKKQELLNLHCSMEEDYGFYSSQDTPTQPLVRRKFSSVIFSDSEDDNTKTGGGASRRMLLNSDDDDLNLTAPTPNLINERWCNPIPCSNMNMNEIEISSSMVVPETEFDNGIDDDDGGVSCRSVSNSFASSIECVVSESSVFDVPVELMPFEGSEYELILPPPFPLNGNGNGNGTQESLANDGNDIIDVPIGYEILDECSRMEFVKMFNKSSSSSNSSHNHQKHSVEETWKTLKHSKMELRHYITPQEKHAFQAIQLTNGFLNCISDSDLLLKHCQPLIEEEDCVLLYTGSHSWHDDQLHMSNIYGEHGINFYSKQTGYGSSMAFEMLASSTSPISLGKKLLTLSQTQQTNQINTSLTRLPLNSNSPPFKSKMHSCLKNVLLSVVPLKSYLSLQATTTCYEYLSSLSQISRSQHSSVNSECVADNKRRRQRRGRGARHYLTCGKFGLTSQDISLLAQYNHYHLP